MSQREWRSGEEPWDVVVEIEGLRFGGSVQEGVQTPAGPC